MKIVLVEPDGAVASIVMRELVESGASPVHFADPKMALLFLVGKVDEVDAVFVNREQKPGSEPLLRQLALFPTLHIAMHSDTGLDGLGELDRLRTAAGRIRCRKVVSPSALGERPVATSRLDGRTAPL